MQTRLLNAKTLLLIYKSNVSCYFTEGLLFETFDFLLQLFFLLLLSNLTVECMNATLAGKLN